MLDDTVFIREVALAYKGRAHAISLPIDNADSAAIFLKKLIGGETREHFVAVYTDTRICPIGFQIVSIGSANSSLVHPREVFQPAVHLGACGILVGHNHPSGNSKPSVEDRKITSRLVSAGLLLGIRLIDHVVIGDPDFYSFCSAEPELFIKSKYPE